MQREHSIKRNRQLGTMIIGWLTAAIFVTLVSTAAAKDAGAKFTAAGELKIPKNYRHWVFVGAPLTPNDMNDGKAAFPEFHHVYIDPASFADYKKSGKFPDGTVLIKELVGVGSKSAASGNGYFPGEFIGVAAAVKDAKRFAAEPGYWAYFNFIGADGKGLMTAAPLATAACNGCHQKNAAEDWVFTQFYPVLRAARSGK